MARPPLAMGTHVSIWITKRAGASSYVARCRFRDGVTRWLERSGALQSRSCGGPPGRGPHASGGAPAAPLRPDHTFERAAEVWLTKLDAQVAEGMQAATSADIYRQRLNSVILPAMGQWRLRECTVPHLDAFFTELAATQGPQGRGRPSGLSCR